MRTWAPGRLTRVQKIYTLVPKNVFLLWLYCPFFSVQKQSDENSTIHPSPCAVWLICAHTGSLVLHEHAAFGAVLSDGGWVLVNLSPRRLLRNPLEASAWTRAFQRRPMRNARQRRQGGDVKYIPHGVFRIPGSALGIGHGADLPRQMSALQTHKQVQICGSFSHNSARWKICSW